MKCEWQDRPTDPELRCHYEAIFTASARHGKEIHTCLQHMGSMIAKLWLHDQDTIIIEKIQAPVS